MRLRTELILRQFFLEAGARAGAPAEKTSGARDARDGDCRLPVDEDVL